MTIKKLSLSAVAAAMVTTSAFAGAITVNGDVGLIGQEKLSIENVSLTQAFLDLNATGVAKVTYKPSDIPASSLKNPIFRYEFANAKDLILVDSNISVFEVTTNDTNTSLVNYKLIANNPQISGTNSNVMSFNAVDSDLFAYNNKSYIVADANGTDISNAEINATVVKGSTSDVVLTASLWAGDSQQKVDTASASIAKVGYEYIGSVSKKFDALIDAAGSFKVFHSQHDGTTAQDEVAIDLERKVTIASLGVTDVSAVFKFDQNLTANAYAYAAPTTGGNAFDTIPTNANDFNTTGIETLAAGDKVTRGFKIQVDGTSKIEETKFSVKATVTSGSNVFTVIPEVAGNAGQWDIYGYKAQIPNVAGLSTHDTIMKFTNRSTLDTNIYFTLIDPDGTVATLNSVDNTELAKLPANTTGTYKASDLVALVNDAAFDKTGSISVEVSIPTTPKQVYGMASFKNNALGQFKDLPVYNSSDMSY